MGDYFALLSIQRITATTNQRLWCREFKILEGLIQPNTERGASRALRPQKSPKEVLTAGAVYLGTVLLIVLSVSQQSELCWAAPKPHCILFLIALEFACK